MFVRLDLAQDEAEFLLNQLRSHLEAVEDELVHTDARELQRRLAEDAERLRSITVRLSRLIAAHDEEARALDAVLDVQ
jgi:hypothetical protein